MGRLTWAWVRHDERRHHALAAPCLAQLAAKVGDNLLLDRLFDLLDPLQPVHVLVDLPWIGPDVPRTLDPTPYV